MDKYKPVIGLEIHVELKTKAKMFCTCSGNYFDKKPNSNTCPVCLGLPGALPVPNKQAIDWTILIGKALNCSINKNSKFDRKHYFYPDLAKGYQISQYDQPIAIKGCLDGFDITRVHLEEDTGKLIHMDNKTSVNFNRCGVPLVEIVTEPVFSNSLEVKKFLEDLQTIIRYLGVSDCDMERGSMRLEPNISLMEIGATELPKYKVEVKNINSFNFVKLAIDFELDRQLEILQKGETPLQETRGFNEDKGITYSQRSKENAQDYRYFPDPDIPPMKFSDKYIEEIIKDMPELPHEKIKKYVENFKVKEVDARIIAKDKVTAEFFENIVKKTKDFTPQQIANLINNKKLPTDIKWSVFLEKASDILTPKETNINVLNTSIEKVFELNQKAVLEYKSGKVNVIMFLVGQVMREMKGQADASVVKKTLEEKLSK